MGLPYENVAVPPRGLDTPAPLLGRDDELKVLERFMSPDNPKRALVLVGEAGIGKTTLWKAAISLARDHGLRVLSTRDSDTETTLSFAAVSDLLDGVDLGLLGDLPAPQRVALEVALGRFASAGAASEPFAIPVGLLNTIRILAQREPLLVAVDDVSSVDAPSANALAYAIRRLEAAPVRFIFDRRPGRPSELERALGPEDLQTVEVGPLSFGAISHLVTQRLARSFPRRALRRVFETSGGNALFALELARSLIAHGVSEIGADLPLPDLLDEVFGARISGLSGAVRRVLLAVALSPRLTRSALDTVADPLAVDDALASGLVVDEGSQFRASHPLIAAAARRQSTAPERRELHRELAAALADPTLRARHMALAATSPDSALAATLAAAAADASERAAIDDAVELAVHALRLTPRSAVELSDRVLALAEFLQVAGHPTRATQLLIAHMDDLPPGRPRAIAHLILAETEPDLELNVAHLDRALAETSREPRLHALVVARKALLQGVNKVERIPEAEAMVEEALVGLDPAEADLQRRVLTALAWMRILRGRQVDDLVRRVPIRTMRLRMYETSLARPIGVRLAFRGRVGESRTYLERHLALAEEYGEAQAIGALYLHLCEIAMRAGSVAEAARLLGEWDHWTAQGELEMRSTGDRLRALLFALRGEPERARRLAAQVLSAPPDIATAFWNDLEAHRAVGIALLFEHDATGAVEPLKSVWDHTAREGVDDPGAFPVAGDLVEALVEAGDLEAAHAVTQRLASLSSRQKHPWGKATARRAAAMLRLVNRYDEEAAADLAGAAADYGRLGLEFDRARTLLFLGRLQRRFKKRSDARRSLEDAANAFDHAGSTGWAAEARSELARVSGRRSADDDELTASEMRVAELAASGLSNKEIASRLFVTVYTVEAHLSHAYAKLGVRSRAALTHRLVSRPQG